MNKKIIIIGHDSVNYHIGSMFNRAAQELNLRCALIDNSWESYAPSMKYLSGRAFFKIAGKRPLEWWSFNDKTVALIEEFCSQVVLVTGIFPLKSEVFYQCNKVGAKIVNYLTDSPWSKQNSCPIFIKNLPKYDCIFSTKTALTPNLVKAGAKQVYFLPFALDPLLHRYLPTGESQHEYSQIPDVCLVGGADADRINFINNFLFNFKGKLGLYGGYWHKNKQLKQFSHGVVFGDVFCTVVHNCKINIGLVRRANKDGHSMRSYEIPACGGVGIYEDTPEHRDLFQGYPEYGFFTSPEDLADKCNWLLEHPVEREQMRLLGIQLIVTEGNTYVARLKTILELVGK
ncbi:MAG: glycosyltransferase [Stigonema ocellatum SAG 48.90 = DSM 106950]|nr:glycosyltransferase [Stigonema ocellatum SAG 48.90 = DSM 106950]